MSLNGYSLTKLIEDLKWLDKSQPGCVVVDFDSTDTVDTTFIGLGEEKAIIQRTINISIVCPPGEFTRTIRIV